MKNQQIMGLLSDLIETEKEKDSIELGSAGNRIKIYLNFATPQKAREKIELALGCREYANLLLNPEGDVDMERMEKFLKASIEQDSDEEEIE